MQDELIIYSVWKHKDKMMSINTEVKITIAKVLEVAYSKNKGLTKQIVLKKGNFKVKINEEGKVKLYGSAGAFTLAGSFDLIELLSSCSGLLCQAVRSIRNRDRQLLQIMGH